MNYLSLCSGIEAATVAWHPMGWRPVGFSEIEPFPCSVLAHHYPDTPNFGDMTLYHEWPDSLRPDLLVAGTPCQAFSVAGLRKGLADPRGNLTLVFLGVLERYRPRWVVWENVPGVLSDRTGAFGALLGGLGELGYGFAYRVLDAQYYGVAQRRRRVFVVGCLGDWRAAAAVLFEPESLRGDPPPRRRQGEGTAHSLAPCLGASGRGFERTGDTRGQDCVVAHTLRGKGFDASEDGTGRGTPLVPEVAGSLCADSHPGSYTQQDANTGRLIPVALRGHSDYGEGLPSLRAKGGDCAGGSEVFVAFTENQRNEVRQLEVAGALGTIRRGDAKNETLISAAPVDVHSVCMGSDPIFAKDLAMPITRRNGDAGTIATAMQVRRLTPRECERLQGFPDDYTLIQHRGKRASDGPRYKALGNSMAVPVMRWIGEGIEAISKRGL